MRLVPTLEAKTSALQLNYIYCFEVCFSFNLCHYTEDCVVELMHQVEKRLLARAFARHQSGGAEPDAAESALDAYDNNIVNMLGECQLLTVNTGALLQLINGSKLPG